MSQSNSRLPQPAELSGTRPQSVLSRRALLQGLGAGAAALAAAPALLSSTPVGATAVATTAGLPRAAGTLAGLHGATLSLAAFPSGTTWAQAIADWESYTGTTINASKIYNSPGVFPTTVSTKIQALIGQGIKALLSFKPAFNPPASADLAALANSLQMYRSAGLTATVTLWPEAQDQMTASQFHRVFQYYGRTVRQYYPLAYDAAGSRGPTNWKNYYPGASLVDVVAIDYYATAYVKGITLDTIVAIADNASPAKPFGIWEMGNSTGATSPAQSQIEAYFSYIQSLMAGRLQAGKANAEIAWYNGDGVNTISSSSDYRVPLWDSLVNATS
jgi:hypothetical protein